MPKYLLAVLVLLSLSSPCLADGDSSQPAKPPITPEDLRNVFRDLDRQDTSPASALDVKDQQRSPTKPATAQLSSLINKLTNSTKIEGDTLLENLARQVDTLKNKVVIERASLLATQSPRKVRVLGSKTIFNYSDTAIFEITSAIDHVTDVQLKPGESLKAVPTAGDVLRWHIDLMTSGTAPNEVTHLIIKPQETDIETNLVVTTDQRVYQLHLKSGSFHMPVVGWNYPEDFAVNLKDAIKKEEPKGWDIFEGNRCYSYKIRGDYDWKPITVFDDGVKTVIEMPRAIRTSEKPVLYVLDDDDEPMPVNYRAKGNLYIVDRLFKEAELRVGVKHKVTIRFDDGKTWLERLFS